MLISPAFAQATEAAAQQGSMYGTLLQLGLIFVIFYLLLIRPQQKKIKPARSHAVCPLKKATPLLPAAVFMQKYSMPTIPLTLK